MRHITLVPIAANPAFGGSTVVRRSLSPIHTGLRHFGIVGLTSLSILTIIIADARAQAGHELNEKSPALVEVPNLSNEVPAVPVPASMPDSAYAPHDIGSSSPEVLGYSVENEPPLIQDLTHESLLGELPSSFDLYSPMPTSEILMPMTSAPVMLLPKTFVHQPKLLRMSDRSAEIWVKLPERAYVSVNFVEYPPEGTFRIFRTKFATQEPRRYYISARQGSGKDEIALTPTTLLSIDDANGLHFVDLFPGQRAEIEFPVVDAHATLPDVAMHDATSHPVEEKLDAILKKLGTGDSTIDRLIERQTAEITKSNDSSAEFHRKALEFLAPLATMQQALAPHDASTSVTRRFHFDEAGLKVTGKATVLDGRVTAIDWTNHPVSVSLVAPKSIKALPSRPFEATVTFSLRQGVAEPFSTFEPTTIQFNDAGENVFAQIAFLEQFAGALTDALVKAHAGPGTYRISATISYELELGELGHIGVAGGIQNTIELVIQP